MSSRSLTLLLLLFLAGPALGQTLEEEIGLKLAASFKIAGASLKVPPPPPKPKPKAPEGLSIQGGRTLSVLSTAYCLRGQTASGSYVKHGTIAVDPRVIPMGSRIYVPGYGWGIAADTGGMIKGNVIDIWLPTSRQCYDWGVRRVTIKVFPRRRR